jgi:hypothetical protein
MKGICSIWVKSYVFYEFVGANPIFLAQVVGILGLSKCFCDHCLYLCETVTILIPLLGQYIQDTG